MNINRSKQNYILLLMGKIVSQLGDGIFTIAMPWFILSVTNSAIFMSVYLVIENVVCGIGLLLFGRKIDAWKKEKIMYIADFVRGFYLLFLFFIASMGFSNKLVFIYIAAIVLNLCAAAFNPASMSIIPLILKKEKLVKGNSILSVVDNTIAILGLTVGVVVYEILGIKLVFLVSGIAYIGSAISEVFIKPDNQTFSEYDKQEKNSGMLDGIRYLFQNKKILFIIIFALTWNYIYISLYSIYIPYVFNIIFSDKLTTLGMIQIAEGIGLILGATLSAKIDMKGDVYRNLTKVVLVQLPLFICFTVCLILNQVLLVDKFLLISYMVILFVLGITVAIVNVNVNVILQTETSRNYLGRVSSIKSLCSMISMALGLLIGGVLIENINYIVAFGINSILFVLLSIFMVINFFPSFQGKQIKEH